jgi:hypothetical protein
MVAARSGPLHNNHFTSGIIISHPVLAQATTTSAALPRDLTGFGVFMSATLLGKSLMAFLVFASILSWTIFKLDNMVG